MVRSQYIENLADRKIRCYLPTGFVRELTPLWMRTRGEVRLRGQYWGPSAFLTLPRRAHCVLPVKPPCQGNFTRQILSPAQLQKWQSLGYFSLLATHSEPEYSFYVNKRFLDIIFVFNHYCELGMNGSTGFVLPQSSSVQQFLEKINEPYLGLETDQRFKFQKVFFFPHRVDALFAPERASHDEFIVVFENTFLCSLWDKSWGEKFLAEVGEKYYVSLPSSAGKEYLHFHALGPVKQQDGIFYFLKPGPQLPEDFSQEAIYAVQWQELREKQFHPEILNTWIRVRTSSSGGECYYICPSRLIGAIPLDAERGTLILVRGAGAATTGVLTPTPVNAIRVQCPNPVVSVADCFFNLNFLQAVFHFVPGAGLPQWGIATTEENCYYLPIQDISGIEEQLEEEGVLLPLKQPCNMADTFLQFDGIES